MINNSDPEIEIFFRAELKKLRRELDRFMALVAEGCAREYSAEIKTREAPDQDAGPEQTRWLATLTDRPQAAVPGCG